MSDKLPVAFAFTAAATLGVVINNRTKFKCFIMGEDVDMADLTRFIKEEDDRKKVVFIDGVRIYKLIMSDEKRVNRIKKNDVQLITCDTPVNLEKKFFVVDAIKQNGTWVSSRMTIPLIEQIVDGTYEQIKSTEPSKLNFREASVDLKIRKTDAGKNKKGGPSAAVAVKYPSLQGLIIRLTKHVESADDKIKIRDRVLKVVIGKKSLGDYTDKLKALCLKKGIEDAVYSEVFESIKLLVEDGNMATVYSKLESGSSINAAVSPFDKEIRDTLQKNVSYVLKSMPIEVDEKQEPVKLIAEKPKKKMAPADPPPVLVVEKKKKKSK